MSKRRPTCSSPCRNSDEKKIKITKAEVQMLVTQEVRSVMKVPETKLDSLIEKVQQQMGNESNYETGIHELQTRLKKIKRRGDKAIDYFMKLGINSTQDNMQKKSPLSSPVVPAAMLDISRSDSEDGVMEPVSLTDDNIMEDEETLFQIMDSVKKALKKMNESNEAVKDAIEDLIERPPILSHCDSPVRSQCTDSTKKALKKIPKENEAVKDAIEDLIEKPPILSHCDSPVRSQCTKILIKSESADHQVEQKADSIKVEQLIGNDNSNPEPTYPVKVEPKLPPLPAMPFPSILSMVAVSYNIPQRLTLELALIRKPPGLVVLWKGEEDSSEPPMDRYSIFMTLEQFKGVNIFPEWKLLSEVQAIQLPQCVMISKHEPGYKAYFAVVGKDIFGRYGPYSNVVPCTIPL